MYPRVALSFLTKQKMTLNFWSPPPPPPPPKYWDYRHTWFVVLEIKLRALCVLGKALYQLPLSEGNLFLSFILKLFPQLFFIESVQAYIKLRIKEP